MRNHEAMTSSKFSHIEIANLKALDLGWAVGPRG